MNNIIANLRRDRPLSWENRLEAADEIARLREENARLREAHEKIGYDFSLNRDEAAIVARVAICKGGNDAK